MVFNTTFKNIYVISEWSVLYVEETRFPREDHWSNASRWQTYIKSNKLIMSENTTRN